MRHPFKLLFSLAFVVTAFFLPSSCTTQKIYQGPELPNDEISVVKTGAITFPGIGFRSTYFRKVDKSIMPKFTNEVQISPGNHVFFLESSVGLFHYDRSIRFKTEAGREYKIFVRNSGNNVWAEDVQTGEVVAGNRPSS